MPKSFNYKSKRDRLKSYDSFHKNHATDKLFLDNFIDFEPDTYAQLATMLYQIKPTQKYMGIIFAKIFNLILKINHMNSGGHVMSYWLIDANFKPVNKTVYALTGLGVHTRHLDEANKSGYMYMRHFLAKQRCPSYFGYNNDFTHQTQEFWVNNIVSLPSYQKYFSTKNGSFVSEAELYVNDFMIFLEKINLESKCNI